MATNRSAAPAQWYEVANTLITGQAQVLADRIMARHFERAPHLQETYTERQCAFYLEDTQHNLRALSAAVLLETPQIFSDYVAWLVNMLQARNIPTKGLPLHFECTREILQDTLPEEIYQRVREYLDEGARQIAPATPQSEGA
ncbi:MAG TPA: hypothetical protein VM409_04095 [Chloroflexia bacterium]|nr:hypothetical protein [Chloroflexia bacterium]